MQPKGLGDISFPTKIKIYPDGSTSALTASRPIFRLPGYEERGTGKDRLPPKAVYLRYDDDISECDDMPEAPEPKPDDIRRARQRASASLRDLAFCNLDLCWFVTFTVRPDDSGTRYDVEALTRILWRWLDNRVRRHGLKYILVPELHKDGAVHFHGLINDSLEAVYSGTIIPPGQSRPRKPRSRAQAAEWLDGGHAVFNLPDWSQGYSTAIRLYGEPQAAIAYVAKYIGKTQRKIGGRWYYSGGDLRRPDVQFTDDDWDSVLESNAIRGVHASTYQIDAVNLSLTYSSVTEVGMHYRTIYRELQDLTLLYRAWLGYLQSCMTKHRGEADGYICSALSFAYALYYQRPERYEWIAEIVRCKHLRQMYGGRGSVDNDDLDLAIMDGIQREIDRTTAEARAMGYTEILSDLGVDQMPEL